MRGINKIILLGRLTADPEVRYTGNEMAVTGFCLAINRGKQKDGSEAVDFINCVAFGPLAKICGEYLKKGKLTAVEGRLQVRNYETKDKQKKTATEVIVDEMQMLDSKPASKEVELVKV
ncbi:MAG: single-stranded DNA-binding protein [bacterium]